MPGPWVLPARLFDTFTWADGATLLTAALATFLGIVVLVVNLVATATAARRERQATTFAEALRSVSDYLEGPYRITRKDASSDQRFAISTCLSDVKSRIGYSQTLLQLHASPAVAAAYDAYVAAAQAEAGAQMHEAWAKPPTTSGADMNLGVAYDTAQSSAKRARVVAIMQADLRLRWWSPVSWWRWFSVRQQP